MPYTSPTWVNGASPAISAENLQDLSDTVAESQNWYLTCSTAANTNTKTVTAAGFVISEGMKVNVRFTNGNTAASPTLDINGTGAYPLYSIRTATYVSASELPPSTTALVTFSGTAWLMLNPVMVHLEGTVSIPASSWSTYPDGQGYYTATVSTGGVQTGDEPFVGIVKSFTDKDADDAMQEAWNMVAGGIAQPDSIYFYASERPTVALSLQWSVTR